MTLDLFLKSNENCYMYGSIYIGDEYVCDTLQFGSDMVLKPDIYVIDIAVDIKLNERYMTISDYMGNVISRFIKKPTFMYKNIEMRVNDNKICLGTKINHPLLTMCDFSTRYLGLKVAGCVSTGEVVYLVIHDESKLFDSIKSIKCVTSY